MTRPAKGVAAVILAAGASTRLGQPKQLATLGRERLLERAVRVAVESGCDPVVVVLGAQAQWIRAECDLGSAGIVNNAAWAEGMASSIRAGIAAVWARCDRALVMACDQPAVTPAHLKALIGLCGDQPAASGYAGRGGVPACFPARCFAELLALAGDHGAKQILSGAPMVELSGGELDVDTPETLRAAQQLYA